MAGDKQTPKTRPQRYFCPFCFKCGEVQLPLVVEVPDAVIIIYEDHKKMSPECIGKVENMMVQKPALSRKRYQGNIKVKENKDVL